MTHSTDLQDSFSTSSSETKPLLACAAKSSHAFYVTMIVLAAAGGWIAGRLTMGDRSSTGVSLPVAQTIIHKLSDGQADVSKVFPGPKGLTGMVLTQKGGRPPVIAWMTNTRSSVIVGGVIDAQTNQNLTVSALRDQILGGENPQNQWAAITGSSAGLQGAQVHGQESAPSSKQDGSKAIEQWISSHQKGITQPGTSGPHTLYMFFDPNCSFCHQTFMTLQQHLDILKKAGIRLEYIPVAFLKPDSLAKAASIEQKGFPALLENEKRFSAGDEEGGLKAPSVEDLARDPELRRAAAVVQSNTEALRALAQANGVQPGTPTFVWIDAHGVGEIFPQSPTPQVLEQIARSMQSH